MHIGGELAHLVGHSAIGILIGHRQHLVGLQGGLERHIAQGGIQGVLRRVQQAGTLELLVVGATVESTHAVEQRTGLVDITGGSIVVHQRAVLCVRAVGGHGQSGNRPPWVAHSGVLAQVGQGNDVTGVVDRACLVGHPYLNTVDVHTGGEVGQGAHGGIVFVAEILREEEVAVFLVVGSVDLEGRQLHAAFRRHAARRRLLLADHRLQLQPAELPVGADAEERRRTHDER